ncbi:MAG TPA: cytochrome c [Steroidobacteraceae bacterium]|jgi:cytochrome c556|nr:cytochrome c [Steroidobacteraceae bacterium]
MKTFACVLGASVLLVVAYEVHPAAALPNLHDPMKNIVAVQTQVIWDVGNQAQDDQGNPDASKLAAGDWTQIIDAAGKVRQVAQTLAQSAQVIVAAPGEKIEGEGNADALGAKQVQAAIDAQPAEFRARSQALAASMDQIIAAAKAKDAKKLFDVSGALDQVCEDCHMKFWYPGR